MFILFAVAFVLACLVTMYQGAGMCEEKFNTADSDYQRYRRRWYKGLAAVAAFFVFFMFLVEPITKPYTHVQETPIVSYDIDNPTFNLGILPGKGSGKAETSTSYVVRRAFADNATVGETITVGAQLGSIVYIPEGQQPRIVEHIQKYSGWSWYWLDDNDTKKLYWYIPKNSVFKPIM